MSAVDHDAGRPVLDDRYETLRRRIHTLADRLRRAGLHYLAEMVEGLCFKDP